MSNDTTLKTSGWSRRSRHERGYGTAWDKLRIRVLKRDCYLCQCQRCKASGAIRPASQVDHVVPKAQGGTDDPANLQAINGECHRIKTDVENGRTRKKNARTGIDGWPVDG